MGNEEQTRARIKEIEDEMARTQKNKATNGHLGLLKARIAKLKSELVTAATAGGGGGGGDGAPGPLRPPQPHVPFTHCPTALSTQCRFQVGSPRAPPAAPQALFDAAPCAQGSRSAKPATRASAWSAFRR